MGSSEFVRRHHHWRLQDGGRRDRQGGARGRLASAARGGRAAGALGAPLDGDLPVHDDPGAEQAVAPRRQVSTSHGGGPVGHVLDEEVPAAPGRCHLSSPNSIDTLSLRTKNLKT